MDLNVEKTGYTDKEFTVNVKDPNEYVFVPDFNPKTKKREEIKPVIVEEREIGVSFSDLTSTGLMKIDFSDKGINHEYRVRDGAHTWSYWRGSLPTVLEFVSKGFHQN